MSYIEDYGQNMQDRYDLPEIDELIRALYPPTHPEFRSGQRNAIAHALASALITMRYTDREAKMVGDMREYNTTFEYYFGNGNDLREDTYRDLYNNQVGREIGRYAIANGLSENDVLALVEDAARSGQLAAPQLADFPLTDPELHQNWNLATPEVSVPPTGPWGVGQAQRYQWWTGWPEQFDPIANPWTPPSPDGSLAPFGGNWPAQGLGDIGAPQFAEGTSIAGTPTGLGFSADYNPLGTNSFGASSVVIDNGSNPPLPTPRPSFIGPVTPEYAAPWTQRPAPPANTPSTGFAPPSFGVSPLMQYAASGASGLANAFAQPSFGSLTVASYPPGYVQPIGLLDVEAMQENERNGFGYTDPATTQPPVRTAGLDKANAAAAKETEKDEEQEEDFDVDAYIRDRNLATRGSGRREDLESLAATEITEETSMNEWTKIRAAQKALGVEPVYAESSSAKTPTKPTSTATSKTTSKK